MQMRLTRRSESYLPMALLLPALLGRAADVLALLAAYMLMRLATLAASDAFRRAAAGEVSNRRVRAHASTALFLTLALGAAAWRWGPVAWEWLFAAPPAAREWNYLSAAGGLMALSRFNGEHLRARAQDASAELLDFLSAAMLSAALVSGEMLWLAAAAALGALLSSVIAVSVGGWPLGLPSVRLLLHAPATAARSLLYPLPGLLLAAGFLRGGVPHAAGGYLLGLAAFGCAASTFRRTKDESAGLNLWLMLPAAAMSVAAFWFPEARAAATLLSMASLSAMAVNAALSPRTLAAMLLAAAACASLYLGADWARWAAVGTAALLTAALLPDMGRLRLQNRARRHRRKNVRSN